MNESTERDVRSVWANGRTPVIAVPPTGEIKIRMPYSAANREWLQLTQRRPRWDRVEKCWFVPRAWLNRIAKHVVATFGQCYVIQSVRETEKCAPACWNAEGIDCDCSCRGKNHGLDNDFSWFVVSETFACRSGSRQYSVRLLKSRALRAPTSAELTNAAGVKWQTYFARAGNLTKIGKSADVESRLRSLQTGCPHEICLLGVVDGDHESAWHERFADRRIQGEWFRLGDYELRVVQAAIDGQEAN